MAAEKAPAFQFYPKDFIGDTNVQAMSLTERGAYITLLCACWLDGSLSGADGDLARILKISPDRMGRLRPYLERCFTVGEDGRWIHGRLEKERAKQAAFRERASRGGSATQVARKQKLSTAKRALKVNTPISHLPSTTDVPKEQEHPRAHPVKAFLTLYDELFVALSGKHPDIDNRDAKIAKTVIEKRGFDEAQTLLRAFFASSDPFIQRAGYGLNIFAGQLNKLLLGDRPVLTATGTEGRGRTGAAPAGKYDNIAEQD